MNDGGPAFPTISSIDADKVQRHGMLCHDVNGETGMSLRDWFAGMVMQGMVAGATERGTKQWDENLAASYAYKAADSLLKERDRE